MNRVERLREVVKALTPMLAGRGLVVTQVGTQAYAKCDPKTGAVVRINIPHIADDADESFCRAIQGFIDHEVAHALFTDFAVVLGSADRGREKAIEFGHNPNDGAARMHSLHNIVEDTFIERKMSERFKGTSYNLDQLTEMFLERVTGPALKKVAGDAKAEFSILVVVLIRAWSGQKAFKDFMDKVNGWENEFIKELIDGLPQRVIDQIPRIKDSFESLEVAESLYNVMYPSKKKEPPPPPCEKPGEEEEGAGSGGKPSDSKEKSDSKTGKGSATDKPEDEDDKGSKGEKDEGEADGEKDEEAKEDEATGEPSADGDEPVSAEDPVGEDDDGERDPKSEPDAGDEDGEETPDADGLSDGAEPEAEEDGEEEEGSTAEDGEDDGDDSDADGADGTPESDADDASAKGKGGKGGKGEKADEVDGDDLEVDGGAGAAVPSKFEDFEPDPSFADPTKEVAKMIADESLKQAREADYIVVTKDWDKIEPPRTDHPSYPGKVADMENDVRHMIGPMQKAIERMMAARSQVVKVPGFRSGRLHGASLHRMTVQDDRLFRRIHENKSKETAVSLLIDCSGSMGGSKIETAMKAGYALSSTLERVGIKHEVLGFTTGDMTAEQAEELREEVERLGESPTRTETIYMPIFKDWDERINPEIKKRFVSGYNCEYEGGRRRGSGGYEYFGVPLRNNIDGECVRNAGHRLLKRREPRKVMIVLSDGEPACFTRDPKEIYADLHRAIAELEKAKVEVVGLGIQTKAVKTFYKKHSVLTNLSALPGAVMGELTRILSAA